MKHFYKLLFLVFFLMISMDGWTQTIVVTGQVTDENDEPMPGVNVMIEGTSRGTVTDVEGSFSVKAPEGNVTLVFSFIGYKTREVLVEDKLEIHVSMEEDAQALDEVVIVGFGTTEKRSELIGAVTSINPSDLKVPSSNLTNALAGRASGVIAYQRSGEPGQDNAEFYIRGVTTFGYKTSPLILIDGIELTTTDLARLNVDDIANFSILKDATSTAIYGARGANGVILVTTKQGTVGKAKLSVRLENSISMPTREIELADPVTYMKMANEAILTRDPLGEILYSDDKIEKTGTPGTNPYIYPANDWKELMFKDYTMNQRANLNLSGGGGVARYFVSGSFSKDNGIMRVDKRNNFNNNIDLKSYTLRTNVAIDLTKSTELVARLSGNFDDYTGPIDGGAQMYNKVMRSNPVLFPAYYPIDDEHQYVNHIMFGNYDHGDGPNYINPYADMTKGYKDYSRSLMLAQFEVKQDLSAITKGLSFRTMVNTTRTSYFDVSRYYNPFFYGLAGYDPSTQDYNIEVLNENTATEYLGYDEGRKEINSTFYLESMLNFNRAFGKHTLSGLLVYMMQQRLNANAGDIQLSLPFRNLGVSGRAMYSYDSRYFMELNFGYNGSERFSEDKRFGFFPSLGFAWSVSNEAFFEPVKPIISNLRLKATYGLIGNDAIGSPQDRFFYLSNVNMNDGAKGATFGRGDGTTHALNGISISRYANRNITWETATKKNLSIELGLLNKFNVRADFFSEVRQNILMSRSYIPQTMGLSSPIRANVGEASGRGIDVAMDYQQSLSNGLYLSAMGNFTYATSKYEVFEEPEYDEAYRSRVGNSIHQRYGYIAERLFIDDEEAENSPRQNFGEYGGGDIKYTDVNRDGQITPADMVPLGNPTLPEITYGFGFSLGYKNFDISAFFQGLANESFWINVNATSPFQNETQVLKVYADNYWSEEKQNVHALWPRLSPTVNNNNAQLSTWFMRDGSFLRMKQLELGYSLPDNLLQKINATKFRIYVNASNLFTISKFDLWDVEMGGNGLGYPIQKVFNLGINVTFN